MDPSQDKEKKPSPEEAEGSEIEISSPKELNEALDIARSFKTYRRDASTSGQEISQNLDSVLQKDLSRRLDSLVLIPSQDRESVIARTPAQSIATSTPSTSPNHPLLPPRNTQLLIAPPLPPKSRSCSPSGSELSSIHGEVFTDSEIYSPRVKPPAPSPLNSSRLGYDISSKPSIKISITMEEAEKAVFRKCQDLREKLRWFTADDVDENRINTKDIKDSYTEELRNIKDAYHEAARSIKDLLLDYNMALPSQRKEYWKQEEDAIFNETKTNERQVRAAVTRITANLTSPVAVSPASLQDSNSSDVLKGKRKKALSKMQTLHEAIGKDSEKLQDKIYLVKDWKLEDDVSISRDMKKAEKWEEDLDKIVQMMRELKTLKREHDVADREVNCSEAERLVEDLEVEVEDVKQQIVSEDNERELYSLDISKTSKVNLPTFGGKNHEDFSKFKMDVEKAFKTNRTSRDEQIIKLRECLKGQARKLVPDSNVTDIKEAWKILKQAFGNPIKIIQQRKEALLKLGTLPKRMSNRSIEIAWYIDMTTFLRELIDLGIKNPDYSELIFLNQFAMEIRHLFPNDTQLVLTVN